MKLSIVNEFFLLHHQSDDPKQLAAVTELDIRTVKAALKRFAKQSAATVTPATAPQRMRGAFDIKNGTVSMTPAQAAADDNINRSRAGRSGRNNGDVHIPFPGQPSQ